MSISPATRVHIRVSAEASRGSRKTMEDFTVMEPQEDSEAFFGVFDGHGGNNAALFASKNLWAKIRKQKDFYSNDPGKVAKGIKNAFVEIHQAMWKERDSWPKTKNGRASTSGTTASVVILRGCHMFVANVGDSRVVLASTVGETLKAFPLTKDHKPDDPVEKERIESLGGEILIGRSRRVFRVAWNRVCHPKQHRGPVRRSTKMESVPFLAFARSLGDLWSFNPSIGEFIVSPVPDVHYKLIDPRKDKFVVLASDGLWNAMKNKEVVHFIDRLDNNFLNLDRRDDVTHRLTCRALEKCHERGHRADNISAIVVFFDEEDRTIAPYITYPPPSDTETETTESVSNLSRSNSFASSSSSEEREDQPQLLRCNALAPYITYPPPSDTETETTESVSNLSRSNSFASSSSSEEREDQPQLLRCNAFYDSSTSSDSPLSSNKRTRSPEDGEQPASIGKQLRLKL